MMPDSRLVVLGQLLPFMTDRNGFCEFQIQETAMPAT